MTKMIHTRLEWEKKEPPCETGEGCQFEPRCGKSPLECGENYESLADWAVDMAIEEARLRKKERTQ